MKNFNTFGVCWTKNQYRRGIAKKGGAWTVCKFKGVGLGKKEGGWYPNAHSVYPMATVHHLFAIFVEVSEFDGLF